jgi:hypothetical protein
MVWMGFAIGLIAGAVVGGAWWLVEIRKTKAIQAAAMDAIKICKDKWDEAAAAARNMDAQLKGIRAAYTTSLEHAVQQLEDGHPIEYGQRPKVH